MLNDLPPTLWINAWNAFLILASLLLILAARRRFPDRFTLPLQGLLVAWLVAGLVLDLLVYVGRCLILLAAVVSDVGGVPRFWADVYHWTSWLLWLAWADVLVCAAGVWAISWHNRVKLE